MRPNEPSPNRLCLGLHLKWRDVVPSGYILDGAIRTLCGALAVEYDASSGLVVSLGTAVEVAMNSPALSTEAARLAALDRYAILDTDPEQSFDDLVILASYICKTPIALLSLLDDHRQWFKSTVGVQVRETPLEMSICAHAIKQEDLFIVPDTLQDARFRENPMVVGEPHIRFYAGAPLINEDGFALGTLCVLDRQPRELDLEQKQALKSLRQLALKQMELRRNLQLLKDALNDRTREEHARELELKRLEEKLVRVLGLKI